MEGYKTVRATRIHRKRKYPRFRLQDPVSILSEKHLDIIEGRNKEASQKLESEAQKQKVLNEKKKKKLKQKKVQN